MMALAAWGARAVSDRRGVGPTGKPLRVDDGGLTVLRIPKVRAFVDAMIEGADLEAAARANGLRIRRARSILRDPAVRRVFVRGIEDVRQSTRARNVLLGRTLVEHGMKADATAAQQKVALEAARYLGGDNGRPGVAVSVNVTDRVAGYVMDLREDDEIARARAVSASCLPVLEAEAADVQPPDPSG